MSALVNTVDTQFEKTQPDCCFFCQFLFDWFASRTIMAVLNKTQIIELITNCPIMTGTSPEYIDAIAEIFLFNEFQHSGSTLEEMLQFSTIDEWGFGQQKKGAHVKTIAALIHWAASKSGHVEDERSNKCEQTSNKLTLEDLVSAVQGKPKKETKHVDVKMQLAANCGNWERSKFICP